MMITTRSKSNLTISIVTEIHDYFESLIKPLVTKKTLVKLLRAFQKKFVEKLEKKLDEQDAKIIELEIK